MPIVDRVLLWLGEHFTSDAALVTSKVQYLFWTLGDVFAVFGFLKITGLARARSGKRRMIIRYLLLWGSALLMPVLFLVKTSFLFRLLACVGPGTHVAIAFYTFIADGQGLITLLKTAIQGHGTVEDGDESRH